VDERHAVRRQARRPTPTEGGPRDVVAAIAAAIREAASPAAVETAALAGIGVGSPGVVDADAGTVAEARNLPGWVDPFPLSATLSEELGAPVAIGNDVQVAVDAEFQLGAGKAFSSLLGVFWGTGIGGGIVLDGELWRGRGAAGEVGHMVVKRNGARCTCGRRGCVEAYAGRAAMEIRARRDHARGVKTELFKIMKKHGHDRLTSGIWERALNANDALATK